MTRTHWRRLGYAFASLLIMFSTAATPAHAQGEAKVIPLANPFPPNMRTMPPGVYPPESTVDAEEIVGLKDMRVARFLSLSEPGGIVWGARPQGPIGTEDALDKRGALLPIPLVLTIQWPRAFETNVRLFAGDRPRKDRDQILTQPLVDDYLPSDWQNSSMPIAAAEWKPGADDWWTVATDTIPLDRTVQAASPPNLAVRPSAGEPAEIEEYDPWEAFNGKTFEFNRRMDKYALKRIAEGWKAVVPQQAEIMIANAFDNLNVVPRVVNNVLQGKWDGAGREVTRFLINSTAGIGGLFDLARDVWHISNSPADFGQTLGKWGTGPGPYVVLPLMEPLTVRDGIGKLVDRAMDPLSYVVPLIPALSLTAGKAVNERALNYELFADFDHDLFDAYTAVRNGYLRRREHMVND